MRPSPDGRPHEVDRGARDMQRRSCANAHLQKHSGASGAQYGDARMCVNLSTPRRANTWLPAIAASDTKPASMVKAAGAD
eukprot:CAMPEP_0198496972 /NCGR_PEP_ID=MMETSP1462-20131121/6147_1 /TAXON_ID=1333877 /ORGANISM="Brandtodinium nutriculum, Strain RCC3387" /LENGTH=79 /DNA_ID=CAMNT_0044225823 /DNA_START=359 /DNA_END=595 /DNA_ORIENTATION=-